MNKNQLAFFENFKIRPARISYAKSVAGGGHFDEKSLDIYIKNLT